jgi:hypothetical protein
MDVQKEVDRLQGHLYMIEKEDMKEEFFWKYDIIKGSTRVKYCY